MEISTTIVWVVVGIGFVLSFFLGFLLAFFWMARDTELQRVRKGYMVVEKSVLDNLMSRVKQRGGGTRTRFDQAITGNEDDSTD